MHNYRPEYSKEEDDEESVTGERIPSIAMVRIKSLKYSNALLHPQNFRLISL
jgi:hypothetical protein